jgi:hypothetical protein
VPDFERELTHHTIGQRLNGIPRFSPGTIGAVATTDKYITNAIDVGIRVAPEPPITSFTSPFLSTIILGHIAVRGRLSGSAKLDFNGGLLYLLLTFGNEKFLIVSLNTIPVLVPTIFDPKL